jgi:hypothetical protein
MDLLGLQGSALHTSWTLSLSWIDSRRVIVAAKGTELRMF